MTQTLYLIRGIPGSGKTTLAKKLYNEGLVAAYYAADDFFTDEMGRYTLEPENLGDAHKWCLIETMTSLLDGRSVAVHNTFVHKAHLYPYIRWFPSKLGIEVKIVECSGTWENTHNVPLWMVRDMNKRFESVGDGLVSRNLWADRAPEESGDTFEVFNLSLGCM